MDIATSNLHATFMSSAIQVRVSGTWNLILSFFMKFLSTKISTTPCYTINELQHGTLATFPPPLAWSHLTFSMGVISKRSILVTSSSWIRSATSEVFTTDAGSSPINECHFHMYITYNVYEQSKNKSRRRYYEELHTMQHAFWPIPEA